MTEPTTTEPETEADTWTGPPLPAQVQSAQVLAFLRAVHANQGPLIYFMSESWTTEHTVELAQLLTSTLEHIAADGYTVPQIIEQFRQQAAPEVPGMYASAKRELRKRSK